MTKKIDDNTRKKIIELIIGGARLGDVAKELGMAYSTFWKYLKQYPVFAVEVENAKNARLDHVIETLDKRANGYEVTERTTTIRVEGGTTDKQGRVVGGKVTKEERVTVKQLAPDVTACMYLLNNLRRAQFGREGSVDVSNPPSVTLNFNFVEPKQIGTVIDEVKAIPAPKKK